MSRRVWASLAALLLMALVAVLYQKAFLPQVAPLNEANGPFSGMLRDRSCPAFSSADIAARCYWYHTDGFQLPVAVLQPLAGFSHSDPIVYLEGGPGQGGNTSSDMLNFWSGWLLRADLGRALILFDYRGLAPGRPAWDCQEYTDLSRRLLGLNLSLQEEGRRLAPVIDACLKTFAAKLAATGPKSLGEGLSTFSTLTNAQDAEAIIRELGYSDWNALGVSYGTRVALVAALQAPRPRRLILDSPYPPGFGGVLESARLWPLSFQRLWRLCGAGQICDGDAAIGEREFWQLMQTLKHSPKPVEVEDWHRHETVHWVLNDARLLLVLYNAMYNSDSLADVGQLLRALIRGESLAHNEMLERFYNQAFDPSFNAMVFFATECADNQRVAQEDFAAWLSTAGPWSTYFSSDWSFDVCRSQLFQAGSLPPMDTVAVPTLVASGELDPVTPPEYAEFLRGYLTRGVEVRLEGKAHAEFYDSECGLRLIRWFLDTSAEEIAATGQERKVDCETVPELNDA